MKKITFSIILIIFVVTNIYTQETGSFKDERDGQVYNTVKIGEQWWIAENLAYKPSSGNFWAYDNNLNNVEIYGYLYDWETANNVCPAGWHLPTDTEWTALTNWLGGEEVAGKKLKSLRGWKLDEGKNHGKNSSGFSALPGGLRPSYNGVFGNADYYGYWWSASPLGSSSYAAIRSMGCYNAGIFCNWNITSDGISVRCIKN